MASSKLYEVFEKATKMANEGKKVSRLYVGEPSDTTPKPIVKAGIDALKQGFVRYGSAAGEVPLRKKIAEIHGVSFEQVVVFPGSKIALYSLLKNTSKPGDEILLPSPHWSAFELMAKDLQLNLKLIHTKLEDGYQLLPDELEKEISANTKALILVNPSNPTSVALKKRNFDKVVEICQQKGVKIISDEAYRFLTFKPLDYELMPSDTTFVTRSFSKTFAMTGWRLGYSITDAETAGKLVPFNQMTFTCVPQFVQMAGLKALEIGESIPKKIAREYKKRALVAEKILSKSFEFAKPDAGFYIFPSRKGLDGDKFCDIMLEKGVGIAPGSAFGQSNALRISLNEPVESLAPILEQICSEVERFK